jgi:hypothetical protein
MTDPSTAIPVAAATVMNSTHSMFLAGVFCALAFAASLLFLRFYRKTGDPLLLLFSVSFFLQGCPRIVMLLINEQVDDPKSVPVYLLRFVAYALIIFAIVQKNWSRRSSRPQGPV